MLLNPYSKSFVFLFIDVLENFVNAFCDKDIVIPVVFAYHVYTEIQRTVQQDIRMRGNFKFKYKACVRRRMIHGN